MHLGVNDTINATNNRILHLGNLIRDEGGTDQYCERSAHTECLGPWKIPIKNITVKFGHISLNHS